MIKTELNLIEISICEGENGKTGEKREGSTK